MSSKSVLSGSRVNAPDTQIAEIAARQHGLVRTSDLRAAGLGTSAVSKRRARGLLHRVYRGVYAVGHAALSREARWLAAVFAAGPGAALCGLAAAELWGLRRAKGAEQLAHSSSRTHAEADRQREGAWPPGGRVLAGVQELRRRDRRARPRPAASPPARDARRDRELGT